MRREEEFLRHAAAEIAALAPRQGEEAELDARRRLMQAAEKMRADVARAAAALSPEGAEGRWATRAAGSTADRPGRWRRSTRRSRRWSGPWWNWARRSRRSRASPTGWSSIPPSWRRSEERLFAMRGLARKARGRCRRPRTLRRESRGAGSRRSTAGRRRSRALRAAHRDAVAAWRDAADRLSHARAEAAKRLDVAMAGELAPLKLERAVFSTELAEADPGPRRAADAVTFTVATNPARPRGR
jgi:DNA repair protein RecN (Recombination protein N)